MANILKIVKGAVKTISVLIALAFVLNSFSGIFGAFDLMDGDSIKLDTINPDDFKINFSDLNVEVGILIDNPTIYDIEGIIIGLQFDIKSNVTDWVTVINKTSVELDPNVPVEGQTILPGESANITLIAPKEQFEFSISQIAELFGLVGNWSIGDLMDSVFEAHIVLTFQIQFAFKQYQLNFLMDLTGDEAKKGF